MSKRILLVDDDKAVQDVCLEWFKDSYNFEVADNALDAFSKAVNHKFDLFIIDIGLPPGEDKKQKEQYGIIKNGLQLANKLRTSREYRFSPIIILSGLIENEEEIKLIRAQMKRKIIIVQKPFRLVELQKEVESFIGKSGGMSLLRRIFRFK